MENLQQKLDPFNFGQLQTFVTIYKYLKRNNIEPEQMKAYVEEQKQKRKDSLKKQEEDLFKQRKLWEEKSPKCQECDIPMYLLPVNTNSRNQVGYDYKSQWYCPNCGEDHYNTEDVEQITKKLLIKE